MKKFTLQIFSVGLAILVLFSTFSFTVTKHYCGKNLISSSVLASAEKCESSMMSCSNHGQPMAMVLEKEDCCSNKIENIEGQDELKIHSFSFNLVHTFYLLPSTFLLPELINDANLKEVPSNYYKPPLLVTDIQAFTQVFLI